MNNPDEHKRAKQAEELVDTWMLNVKQSKPVPTGMGNSSADAHDWWKPEKVNTEVEAAISKFRLSGTALAYLGDDTAGAETVNDIVFNVGDILAMLPPVYVNSDDASDIPRDTKVRLVIDDLWQQMAAGKVEVSIARLVFGVPVGLVTSAALRDDRTMITLPLPSIVAQLDPEALAHWTSKEMVDYDTDGLPALFTERAEGEEISEQTGSPAPELHESRTEREFDSDALQSEDQPDSEAVQSAPEKPHDVADDTAERASTGPSLPGDEAEPETSAKPETPGPGAGDTMDRPDSVETAEAEEPELPSDQDKAHQLCAVDLNSASLDTLKTLGGISAGIAHEIVAYREGHGRFDSIFDLARVPGIGRKRFRRITGMPYSYVNRHRQKTLAKLLGIPVNAISRLPTIASAVAKSSGLTGCVISDKDGLLLAESGVGDIAQTISAVIPRMLRQVRENMEELECGETDSASISVGGRLLTVIDSANVYVSIFHQANRLTNRTLKLVRAVAQEQKMALKLPRVCKRHSGRANTGIGKCWTLIVLGHSSLTRAR